MIRIPGSGFFKDLKADITAGVKELNQAAADGEAERRARADYKDALGTRDYAACIRNLSEVLNRMEPPALKHLKVSTIPEKIDKAELDNEDGLKYLFINDVITRGKQDYGDTEISTDTSAVLAEEMSFGEFLKKADYEDFDVIPVLYDLKHSAGDAFDPKNIEKVVVSDHDNLEQLVLHTKDGKKALLSFVTGRRIVKEPDGSISLIDDNGYKYNEDLHFIYSRKK